MNMNLSNFSWKIEFKKVVNVDGAYKTQMASLGIHISHT
jgi:hypothetical protein